MDTTLIFIITGVVGVVILVGSIVNALVMSVCRFSSLAGEFRAVSKVLQSVENEH